MSSLSSIPGNHGFWVLNRSCPSLRLAANQGCWAQSTQGYVVVQKEPFYASVCRLNPSAKHLESCGLKNNQHKFSKIWNMMRLRTPPPIHHWGGGDMPLHHPATVQGLNNVTSPAETWHRCHTRRHIDRRVQSPVPLSHSRCQESLWWHSLAIQCDPVDGWMFVTLFWQHKLTPLKQNKEITIVFANRATWMRKKNHGLLSKRWKTIWTSVTSNMRESLKYTKIENHLTTMWLLNQALCDTLTRFWRAMKYIMSNGY